MDPVVRNVHLAQAIIDRLHEGRWSTDIKIIIAERQMCLQQVHIYASDDIRAHHVAGIRLAEYPDIVDRPFAALHEFADFAIERTFLRPAR